MEEFNQELKLMLEIFPPHIRENLQKRNDLEDLVEVVLDLGRKPEARYPREFIYLTDDTVTEKDLEFIYNRTGPFGLDNRSGIEKTLHRISAIRNRRDKIVGLTCRVGKAVYGTADIIRDIVERGDKTLLLGRPGVGKTTILREAARILADEFRKRVIIVDTSNEIAGDGDIPHPAIGHARRMQVKTPDKQHDVMIEAVENHMPEVIIIDEIGTYQEAEAARTIAERGVQLIATAHGNTLENLILNPTLSELIGGIDTVTLGDEEAKRRNSQKTVLERKAPSTFDAVVEIFDRNTLKIHAPLEKVVDYILRGGAPRPEIRLRKNDGQHEIIQNSNITDEWNEMDAQTEGNYQNDALQKIYPYAVSKDTLKRLIKELQVPAKLTKHMQEADIMLTVKAQKRKGAKKIQKAYQENIPVHVIRKNKEKQVEKVLRHIFKKEVEENDSEM
ncbi:AAA family ATPase [Natranaerobius thermophilus]|uniref:AAA ATPase n=1 Tax=Natranaerobius thermophilus (strain ATCC BAA-1301 / DSM 18059 / JW/NM-WN-LF) TaxID=457570 RepID=B2A319_NATTJ|nr:AAA family ATPase [Natranaerobius thermophilus]ACB83631.1 AAA ATPase [Natranaerobius thermophilus JW/NM-WN-LF]